MSDQDFPRPMGVPMLDASPLTHRSTGWTVSDDCLFSPAGRKVGEIFDQADQVQICKLLNEGLAHRQQQSPLAGPESAAEHVRNALQLLECAVARRNQVDRWGQGRTELVDAARARLRAALAVLEGDR